MACSRPTCGLDRRRGRSPHANTRAFAPAPCSATRQAITWAADPPRVGQGGKNGSPQGGHALEPKWQRVASLYHSLVSAADPSLPKH